MNRHTASTDYIAAEEWDQDFEHTLRVVNIHHINDPGLKEAIERWRRIQNIFTKHQRDYGVPTNDDSLYERADYWYERARTLYKQQQLDV